MVFVVDTEGDHPAKLATLVGARDRETQTTPAAVVGVAHPCIEAWLLADPAAVKKGLGLAQKPELPTEPETLPAPRIDEKENPKSKIAILVESKREIPAESAWEIAREIRLLDRIRTACPVSFAPFAVEVESRLRPLFK